jgi:hypothetical protein
VLCGVTCSGNPSCTAGECCVAQTCSPHGAADASSCP